MVRIVLNYLSRPVSRFLLRTLPLEDPWERYASPVPLGVYGIGACRDFPWYFEGISGVEVRSIEDVQDWLLGCEYMSDPDLFQEADLWQHPCAFEGLRKGDCEDFSLWAWRKLVRLGYDAEFIAGRYTHSPCAATGHTWVLFRQEEQTFLFDPVIPVRERMIRLLDDVRPDYIPEVSVDRHFHRFVYAGYLLRRHQQEHPTAVRPASVVSMPG